MTDLGACDLRERLRGAWRTRALETRSAAALRRRHAQGRAAQPRTAPCSRPC